MSIVKKSDARPSTFLLDSIDIFVLVAFAFAQPLLGVIARSAAILVVHRAEPIDLLVLALFVWSPAVVLIGIEGLVLLVRPRALNAVHFTIVGILLAIDLLPLAKRISLPSSLVVVLAIAGGAALALTYRRMRSWTWSLAWLTPVILIFPAQFLFFSPVSAMLFPARAARPRTARIGNPAPVVFLLFDEFPLTSLLARDGGIDADLYPNFAQLSRSATWYRNTTTVGESTLLAIPAILSGRAPDPRHPHLPDFQGYPRNLFTMLAGAYRMDVTENDTRLCPAEVCQDADEPAGARIHRLLADASVLWAYVVLPSGLTGHLPDITQSWKNFKAPVNRHITLDMWRHFDNLADWHDRLQQVRRFTASLRPTGGPALYFLHVLLPHAPWEYLPQGQKCSFPEMRIRGLRGVNDRGEDPNEWTGDAWAAAQSQQRHLLQVAFVDHLLGGVIRKLRDSGLYDSSLIVITADHGTSFLPNASRRSVGAANHAELMYVPLFIKYPHQTSGGTDDRPAENVDILPTIIDVLRAPANDKLDGASLLGPPLPRTTRSVVTDGEKRLDFQTGLDDLRRSVARKVALFGEGKSGLFKLGDQFGLTGKPVGNVAAAPPGITYGLDREAYYQDVDLQAPSLITNIEGAVHRSIPKPYEPLHLAVAVNGTVAAVTQTYDDGSDERFSALVPRTLYRDGRNDVAVFTVPDGADLRKVPFVSQQKFKWGTPLLFGARGNAPSCFVIGWGEPEETLTWTDGHEAILYVPVPPPGGDVELRANLGAFTAPGKLRSQHVRVLANDKEVTQWDVGGAFTDYTALIPRTLVGESGLEITFELPDATAPFAIGAGPDYRTLGIALGRIDLTVR